MKAWQLERLGGSLSLIDQPIPQPRTGGVVVRIEASSLMSYMKDYVEGKLPIYHAPDRPFIPGGNGSGYVHAVGPGVWHLTPGQRIVLSSHFVAQENVQDSAEILIGVTANGPVAHRMQADWTDGTLAEYASFPASAVTPADDVNGGRNPTLNGGVCFLSTLVAYAVWRRASQRGQGQAELGETNP
jgi:NADPH:quinone reductase-like Zn-dependent oxidoreductase